MTNKDKRGLAKILYLQGIEQKDIAVRLSCSAVSVSKWKKEEQWDTFKVSLLNSRNERLAGLYQELEQFELMIKAKTGFKCADSKEADARKKLISDISDLERKYNIAQTVTIARDFTVFLKEIDSDFANRTVKYFDAFINKKMEDQKWQNV